MNVRCKNEVNLKFKELRIDYWEQYHQLPTFKESSKAKLILVNGLLFC